MPGELIIPPNHVDVKGPLIFLAGPIQGADNWHEEAIKIIQKHAPDIHIASPRREMNIEDKDFAVEMYNEQVDWETKYLRRAGEGGVVIFWLGKESIHICRRAYAQTSRFELGEWKARHEFKGSKLVVGIEEGFSNAKYIKRRLSLDCPKVPICSSLEETCLKAIEEINHVLI